MGWNERPRHAFLNHTIRCGIWPHVHWSENKMTSSRSSPSPRGR